MITRRPGTWWLALLALGTLLLIGARSALPPVPSARRANVLLLLVDTLRADHLGLYGYRRDTSPNLDRLAQRAFVFRNAHSSAPWTKPAVASLLTGLSSPRHGIVDVGARLARDVPTLATWFHRAGYRTLYISGGNEHVTPSFGLSQAFDEFVMTSQRRLASGVQGAFLKRLDALRGAPFLAVLHYMDAHLPYYATRERERFTHGLDSTFSRRPPETLEANDVYARAGAGSLSASDRAYLEALYDGQIRHVDAQIGDLLDALHAKGLTRETLVVVLSDHGEEFWEHGAYEHGHTLYGEVLRIPLLMLGAGIRPGSSDCLISITDVAPTLLELAGLPRPPKLDGRSAAQLVRTGAPFLRGPLLQSGTLYGPERYALVTDRHKLIVNTTHLAGKWGARRHVEGAALELYDQRTDRAERVDLAPHEPKLREALRSQLERLLQAPRSQPPERVELTEEQRQRLRTLGYAE